MNVPPDLSHYKHGDWIPVPRYLNRDLCLVTLACTHERLVCGTALSWSARSSAGCFYCGRVRDLVYVVKLSLTSGNSTRLW